MKPVCYTWYVLTIPSNKALMLVIKDMANEQGPGFGSSPTFTSLKVGEEFVRLALAAYSQQHPAVSPGFLNSADENKAREELPLFRRKWLAFAAVGDPKIELREDPEDQIRLTLHRDVQVRMCAYMDDYFDEDPVYSAWYPGCPERISITVRGVKRWLLAESENS